MGLFSRRKGEPAGDSPETSAGRPGAEGDLIDDTADGRTADAGGASDAPAGDDGPRDRSLVEDDTDYLNLGALWLRGAPGMELRLEINEQEQQITGVTAVIGESAVQLQAFAAPRTEGVWVDIRNEIAASITDNGGTAEVVTGAFGEELLTRMPQAGADGRTVFVPARFIGVDGPRWFLRAVVSGRAAVEGDAAADIHEVIRTAVVDRGQEAIPPRELLALRLPETPAAGDPGDGTDDGTSPHEQAHLDDFSPFERGPEITEIR